MGQDQGQWSSATETRPFWTLYSVLYQLWSFPIWLVGTGTAPGSVGVLTTIVSYLLRWKSVVLSPSLGCFPYLHAPTSTQLNTQGWPSAGLWSSVSSLTFCPANSSRRLLPRFSTLSPQLSESPPLALPLPVLCPGNSLRAINSESHRGRIICCLSLNNHCSSWLMFTILKTQEWYILFTKSEWSLFT